MGIPPSVYLALVAVQLMFASLSVVGKLALRELTPFALICARVVAATLILALVRALLRSRERVAWRDLPELALYGLFGVSANMLLFIAGLARTTATDAVVIGATIPVFTVGVAVALRKEAATLPKLTGLLVALCGALWIVGASQLLHGGRHFVGDLLVMLNSLSFSIYLVLSRRLLARYSPLTVLVWTFVFGALGILPFGTHALFLEAPRLSARGLGCVAYIVLFPTVGTYFLNVFALQKVPSSLVAIYIYIQPVVGAFLAAAMLDERPSPTTFAGGALIGAGIWMVTKEARRQRAVRARPA